MKIIIFALSGIGDALMFSPALKLLRQRFPDARIDLLAMFKAVAELYQRNPDINTVHFWNFLSSHPFSSLAFILQLRRQRFDISFSVYHSNRWPYNLISFLVGAKKRLGHDYHHINGRSLNFLNNVRVLEDDAIHNVEENRNLVDRAGVEATFQLPPLQVTLNQTDEAEGSEWLKTNNLGPDSLFIGYHTGSALFKNHIHKRWAAEKFARLGKILV